MTHDESHAGFGATPAYSSTHSATSFSTASLSPRGRPHRRSRARNGAAQQKKKKEIGRAEDAGALAKTNSSNTAFAAAMKTAGPNSEGAILQGQYGQEQQQQQQLQQGCTRAARAAAKWQRRSVGEVSSAPLVASSSSSPASVLTEKTVELLTKVSPLQAQEQQQQQSAPLTRPTALAPTPPPPFPVIPLPAWCRSASAVAYPLSEDGLTNELVDFFHYTELTPLETAARVRLLRCVAESVDALWNHQRPSSSSSLTSLSVTADALADTGAFTPLSTSEQKTKVAQVSLYGSYALGLSLPTSDIDLVLTFPAEEAQEAAARRRRQVEHEREGQDDFASDVENAPEVIEAAKRRQQLHLERLHDLADHLRRTHGAALTVDVYDQCRVPRIHLRDTAPGGVSCDINSSLTSARVECIVARQRRWLADAPLAAFLVRITKAAVRQWDLNEVFAGGLASTALYCLVLRFLAQAEQLHRHAKVEEENLSPPRYDEATQSASSLSASLCGSPLSPSSPTTSSIPLTTTTSAVVHQARVAAVATAKASSPSTPAEPIAAATTKAATAATTTTTAAVFASAAIPSYVPSWLRNTKAKEAMNAEETTTSGCAAHSISAVPSVASLGDCETDLEEVRAAAHTCPGDESRPANVASRSTFSRRDSERARSDKGEVDGSEDGELDALTQEALTRTSCPTTTSTTPTSRTANSTPPPHSRPLSELSQSAEAPGPVPSPSSMTVHSPEDQDELLKQIGTGLQPPVLADDFPSAEELTRIAQARYGASPARLLLKLWRALSVDTFLSGYQVADVFGDDAVWATSELKGFSGKPRALPGVAALELATYASRSSTDLSAPSFRLPDLLALFRCTSSSLDNMLRFQRYPRRMAPTMLSTIFVDPRLQF